MLRTYILTRTYIWNENTSFEQYGKEIGTGKYPSGPKSGVSIIKVVHPGASRSEVDIAEEIYVQKWNGK